MTKQFPKDFYWGAATSSHQVEGGQHNDWSEWEKKNADRLAREAPKKYEAVSPVWDEIKDQATNPENYISGQAADHYNRYKEDISIMKDLGLNAFRFSLEWSRIEPAPGQWSQEALDHYADVIRTLKDNNLEPFITLWHRSLPLWVEKQGGWENNRTIKDFILYTGKVIEAYKDSVTYWMPLNEPEFEILGAYIGGNYPPQVKNPVRGYTVFKNLIAAHRQAYTQIHKLQPHALVGIPHAAIAADPYQSKLLNRLVVKALNYFGNWKSLNTLKDYADFLGVQYYARAVINIGLKGKNNYGIPFVQQIERGLPKTDMGFEVDADGIYPYLQECWRRYHKPIIVTENGLADERDRYRAQFIQDIIKNIQKALADGIDIRGYLHWSLLDNLEWEKGFWPKFGLIEVNKKTQERTVRPSAKVYSEIIKQSKVI